MNPTTKIINIILQYHQDNSYFNSIMTFISRFIFKLNTEINNYAPCFDSFFQSNYEYFIKYLAF